MQVPKDFDSTSTFQNSGYFHPHERGVTYCNKEFEKIFRTEYFVPDYVGYIFPKLSKSHRNDVAQLILEDEDVIQMGIFFMRVKSLLMMFENDNVHFLDEFKNQLLNKRGVLFKFKFITEKCYNYILDLDSQEKLSVLFELARIVAQVYIINVIMLKSTSLEKYAEMEMQTLDFRDEVRKFNEAYEKVNKPMMSWEAWSVPFIANLAGALCVSKKLLKRAKDLYDELHN